MQRLIQQNIFHSVNYLRCSSVMISRCSLCAEVSLSQRMYSTYNHNMKGQKKSTIWSRLRKVITFLPFKIPQRLDDKLTSLVEKDDNPIPILPKATTLSVWRALTGNLLSTLLKMMAYQATGSSAMFAETLHGFADTTNQVLLLIGMWQTQNSPDRSHPYGYGKSAFVWSLISAMGTFWMGCALSVYTGVSHLLSPVAAIEFGPWSLFALVSSFCLDGYVLSKTLQELKTTKPNDISLWKHAMNNKDPFVNAVLLEDMAGTSGAIIALVAVLTSIITGNVMFDSLGTIGVGAMLGVVSFRLLNLNTRYLVGTAIDEETEGEICKLIANQPYIEGIKNVQTQYLGSKAYTFKADIDMKGTYIAAELSSDYIKAIQESMEKSMISKDMPVLLSYYSEDVSRVIERELRQLENRIKSKFPDAEYVDLKIGSDISDYLKLIEIQDDDLKKEELENFNEFVQYLDKEKVSMNPPIRQIYRPMPVMRTKSKYNKYFYDN
ncbi:hypothetical protein WA158_001020 [Blastocystis sp. Blastoise]